MENILTNSAGQRIWVVDTAKEYDLERLDPTEIDAIFIDMPKEFGAYVADLIIQIRKHSIGKLYLKSLFISIPQELFATHVANDLIDGVEQSTEAPDFINTTREINQIINRYVELSPEGFTPTFGYAVQILRYNFARQKNLAANLSEQSMIGYNRPLLFIISATGEIVLEVLDELARIAKNGYIGQRFQDKLHLCPQCHSVHLIYREICTRCGSANLTAQPVIHHFRCSNVSPEKEYIDGERLICPKCHKQLRHLGVDYDKPSVVNVCEACNFSSQSSNLVAQCLHCKKITPVEELEPFVLYEYYFNDRTMDFLINPLDPYQLAANKLKGIVSFKEFTLLLEKAIIDLETAEDEVYVGNPDLYLVLYALELDLRYANTRKVIDRDLYLDIMQGATDIIAQYLKEVSAKYLDITFHNNMYMVFANFATNVQSKQKHVDEVMKRIRAMVYQKYGDKIVVEGTPKYCQYKKDTQSILSFMDKVAKL